MKLVKVKVIGIEVQYMLEVDHPVKGNKVSGDPDQIS
jgi:hypothetical protein